MPNEYKNLHVLDKDNFPYIYERDVDVPLKTFETGLIRVNVYRPKDSDSGVKYPALVTYGPYGKDAYYETFRKPSFDEVNPEHKSPHSAWETPDPQYWTARGYVVVRADERGLGQSPGVLDTMSRGTSEAFFDVVEWSASQPWSSGKVGLLGISYYAGSQWRVAARRPKGLAAIIPWEGMSDYYRDRVRHGGILSNKFIDFWWNVQVIPNQYGRPRKENSPFDETREGRLGDEELKTNLNDQTVDTPKYKFRDEEYYKSRDYNIEDIDVPLLSVANWGGILLHLRGNVEGYVQAGSTLKYLRFITGRHDLPFYYAEEAALQQSFLDAFLKGDDRAGWSVPGKLPPVSVVLREGNVGFNDAQAERAYARRDEPAWPLPSTDYRRFYLTPGYALALDSPASAPAQDTVEYRALDGSSTGIVQFTTPPFAHRAEFTGHVTARLHVSCGASGGGRSGGEGVSGGPEDIDLFLTLRHLGSDGKEVFYTGTAGDPVPVTKGWLRVSLRKTWPEHPKHREYLPHREYFSTDVQEVKAGEVYGVDVEVWPTNVVVSPGGKLVLEVSGADTQGCGIFQHDHPADRSPGRFAGVNRLHWGMGWENYVTLPFIPGEDSKL
ncbi:MAG: hypothetical protein M1821_001869 [Bathelium mastoideum]|nr:MAG: hypothetical protein M1821_001869 [Bathelium mastoideum]